MRQANLPRIALAAIFAASLSGCGGSPDSYTCPEVQNAPVLSALPQFGPGAGREPGDVQVAGRISSVRATCSKDAKGVKDDVLVYFDAFRKSGQVRRTDFPYFVAVVDANGNVIAKQNFSVAIEFTANESQTSITDKVDTIIPLKNPQRGSSFGVVVGFQLTKDELDFNRNHIDK
jgi:hypothetical protein